MNVVISEVLYFLGEPICGQCLMSFEKSLQQNYNSFLCSSLLMLSSSVFSTGDNRKHLQAPCGHCHNAVPLLRRSQEGPGTSFVQEKKHPVATASFTAAALLQPKIYCTSCCCSKCSGGNYNGKASRKYQLLEGSNPPYCIFM